MTTEGLHYPVDGSFAELVQGGADVVAQLSMYKTISRYVDLLVSADVRRNGPHASVTIKAKEW